MSEAIPAAQDDEIETAEEPGVRARRVLTLLRSIQDWHRRLMNEKEAGGFNPAEMEEIDKATSGMASGQRSLFFLLKRLMTQELVNGGGSLQVELVGNVQSEIDWKILEAIVDVLNPQQQQLDQQGATSTTVGPVAPVASSASSASSASVASVPSVVADERLGQLRRWILDRGNVIVTIFTRVLDLWLEDFVFSAMSRLNRIHGWREGERGGIRGKSRHIRKRSRDVYVDSQGETEGKRGKSLKRRKRSRDG